MRIGEKFRKLRNILLTIKKMLRKKPRILGNFNSLETGGGYIALMFERSTNRHDERRSCQNKWYIGVNS